MLTTDDNIQQPSRTKWKYSHTPDSGHRGVPEVINGGKRPEPVRC